MNTKPLHKRTKSSRSLRYLGRLWLVCGNGELIRLHAVITQKSQLADILLSLTFQRRSFLRGAGQQCPFDKNE